MTCLSLQLLVLLVTIDFNIMDWINYRPNVGVEGLHITGLPGTGKSNMASALAVYCMKKGEHVVLPGDRFCEWRHFLEYDKTCKVKVIIPSEKMCELTSVPDELTERFYFIPLDDYKDLDIIKIIKHKNPDNKPTVLAIYDACFRIQNRARLWVHILEQLLNRTTFLDQAITMLFHEAGIYWPQMPLQGHWKYVDEFSSLFVDCRKGLVRPILVSQLDNEVHHTIRDKCMVRIHRKGFGSKKLPEPLRRVIPYTALNEYQIQYGGLYVRHNLVAYFKEKKILFKIIPGGYINGASLPDDAEEKSGGVARKQTVDALRKAVRGLLSLTEGNKKRASDISGLSENTLSKYSTS